MARLHLSRQSVRYKSEFCVGKLLLGLRMVSAIRNIEVSVNQGLICARLYGHAFGTFHYGVPFVSKLLFDLCLAERYTYD